LFEIAAILGSREQRAHVEHVHLAPREDFGYLAFDDAPCETLGDGRLADARFAHEEGIVLAPPAQRLDDAFDLALAADQRIDFAHQRLGVEIERIRLESSAGLLLVTRGFLFGFAAALRLLGGRSLGDAVRDVVHHVQTSDALLVQEIHGMGVFLAEDGDQHVGAGYFLLARGLDVQDRALDDALEAEGRLGIDFLGARDRGGMRGDEISERFPQLIDIRGAGAQHLRGGRIVQQREQQVLDGDELMPLLARLYERHVQTDFEFLCDHRNKGLLPVKLTLSYASRRRAYQVSSITHCSGCWCLRA